MNTDQVINILASTTLLVMMAAIGLTVTLGDAAGVARDWRLMARAALANYLCVPAIAVGLLLLLRPHPMVAAGFLVVAVCPGAPYGPPFTALAKGNVAAAVGLMAVLAGSSAFAAPLLLSILLPVVAGELSLKVNAVRMAGALALVQFLPLCAGIFVRQRKPALAARLAKPFRRLSLVLNLLLLGTVLAVQCRMLLEIRMAGYLGMLALVFTAGAAGWLAGRPRRGERKTLAITTSARNVGVGLVIAADSFPATPAIAAVTAYALFQTIVIALAALGWGRMTHLQAPIPEGAKA